MEVLAAAETVVQNEESSIVFSVTDTKGVSDKTVHVEVRVSENSQIASLNIELLFDSSKLLVSKFEPGEVVANGLPVINGNISDKVIMSFASMEPIKEAGTLFSVDFTITSAEANEVMDLDLNITEVTDIHGNSLDNSHEKGTIEVVELLYGDLNFDNRITAVDALKVLSYTTEEVDLTAEELKAADVDGDSKVTVVDALQILYFSAEKIADFPIYLLEMPQNVHVSELGEYDFTIEWDYCRNAIGYNVYFNGALVNGELLTENHVSIGGEHANAEIAPKIHNSIDHNTDYTIEITAVNALKETEKSELLQFKTKRAYSWVTFKDWDGTIIGKTQKVLYGQDAIMPNDPTRYGYVFTGWDKEATDVIDDLVITAQYEVARYDYIFKDYDGKELYRQNIVHDGTVTPPADPERKGYTFSGWYTSADGGLQMTDFSHVVQETTVYARYNINNYTVAFDSAGGSSVANTSASYLSKIEKPVNPTRLGYGFSGWYKDQDLLEAWNFNEDVLEDNITLYAKWTPVTITIDKAALSFARVGETGTLKATITGGADTITWSSSNAAVATVNQDGVVTAAGHGTAVIYIQGSNSERKAVTTVTVSVAKDGWIVNLGGDVLNVRSAATTNSSTLKESLREGAKVTVYGDMIAKGVSGQIGWYNIKTPSGAIGYVSANYVSLSNPGSNLTPGSIRTTAPASNDANYWSNANPFYSSGFAPGGWNIPTAKGNCTWYCWGRVREYWKISMPAKKTSAGYSFRGNASTWWYANKEARIYKYGSAPRAGAIAVFSSNHVAFVEKVEGGRVYYSESGWPSMTFRYGTSVGGSGLLGYIYPDQPY